MNKIYTLFFSIVSFFLLVVLFFYTFFVKDYVDLEKIAFSFPLKESQISIIDWEIKEVWRTTNTWELFDFYSYAMNPIDYIHYLSGSTYTLSQTWEISEIKLNEWSFYIALNDVNKKYHISWKWFNFDFEWVWSFFVLVSWTKHVILSMNANIKVNLIDEKTLEILTTLYVFPHQYIKISPLRNYSLKNADRLRFSTVNTIGYIPKSFLVSWKWNESLNLVWVWINNVFIQKVLQYESEKKNIYAKESWFLNKEIREFPWIQYIEKYKYLFLNENKKLAYLKNKFWKNIYLLFSSEKKDTVLVNETYDISQEIKKIDASQYNKIVDFYSKYYYIFILNSFKENTIDTALNFYSLYAKLNTLPEKKYNTSNLLLSNIFSKLDFNVPWDFLLEINNFSNTFLNNHQESKQEEKNILIDYYSFFLQQLLMTEYSFDSNSFISVLRLLTKYIEVTELLSIDGDEKKIRTGMYVNLNVLKKMKNYILSTFFLEKESEASLLLRNNNNALDSNYVELLDSNITKFTSFFEKNKKIIDQNEARNKVFLDEYALIFQNFDEVILALSDYEAYTLKYDELKSKLLSVGVYEGNENDFILENNKILLYLSQFEGMNLTQSDITVNQDEWYYDIKNVVINGSIFSFFIYPNNNFLLTNIIINWEVTKYSYKLSTIKEKLEELLETVDEPEDSLIFSKFFLVTFFWKNDKTTEIIAEDNLDIEKEDKVIRVFKSTKLLSKRWEFSILSDFITIPYDSLIVTLNNNNYDIALKWVSFPLRSQSAFSYYWIDWILDSNYKLTESQHYFYNTSLLLYQVFEGKRNSFMWGESIKIDWNINLVDFKNILLTLEKNLEALDQVITKVKSNIFAEKIEMLYIPKENGTIIKFDFNGKKANISVSWNSITSILIDWKNLLMEWENSISIEELDTYLKIIENTYGS